MPGDSSVSTMAEPTRLALINFAAWARVWAGPTVTRSRTTRSRISMAPQPRPATARRNHPAEGGRRSARWRGAGAAGPAHHRRRPAEEILHAGVVTVCRRSVADGGTEPQAAGEVFHSAGRGVAVAVAGVLEAAGVATAARGQQALALRPLVRQSLAAAAAGRPPLVLPATT